MYVCECGDATCVERIRLTRQEYEAVRDYSTRFAIAVDHENPEIDQLVTEGGRLLGRPEDRGAPGPDRATDGPAARGGEGSG